MQLIDAILLLKTTDEAELFLHDLCTPHELNALAERWRVCNLLDQQLLSYRAIQQETGASLGTITRISRFLKKEQHQGYRLILNKINNINPQ